MTYTVQTASDVADIPELILAFAEARGWTRAAAVITRPGGGRSFEVTALKKALTTGNFVNPWRIYVKDNADVNRSVFCNVPVLGGPYSPPSPSAPTKVHLFGNNTPWDEEGAVAPWLGIVIEFGYNHYRHIYIGNMVKFGAYTGGEVISANSFNNYSYSSGLASAVMFTDYGNRWLFSAQHLTALAANVEAPSGPRAGGINIVHADNPVPWRRFQQNAPDGNLLTDMPADLAFGGVRDGAMVGGFVRRGVSDFAGADILTPYSMFAPNAADGVDYRIRPLGFVAGPRAIDMRNIQSESQIAVGNRNWRVFAEFQRNPSQTVTRTAGDVGVGSGWLNETSQYIGVAYPETDE